MMMMMMMMKQHSALLLWTFVLLTKYNIDAFSPNHHVQVGVGGLLLTHDDNSSQQRTNRNYHHDITFATYISTSTSTSASTTQLEMVATPPSKYPTKRGSTVDSRKIISQGLAKSNLKAIRLKHILFASKELATSSLNELRAAGLFFDDLARQISNCAESRNEGGEIGWVNVVDDDDDDDDNDNNESVNEHLDLLLPKDARKEVLNSSSKVRPINHTTNKKSSRI